MRGVEGDREKVRGGMEGGGMMKGGGMVFGECEGMVSEMEGEVVGLRFDDRDGEDDIVDKVVDGGKLEMKLVDDGVGGMKGLGGMGK